MGAKAASVRVSEAAGSDGLISSGGNAHSVQAEGKMDFSDPSPVFEQRSFLSLYSFSSIILFYSSYGIRTWL